MTEEANKDPKEKFLEALQKKKQANSPQNQGKSGDSKVNQDQVKKLSLYGVSAFRIPNSLFRISCGCWISDTCCSTDGYST